METQTLKKAINIPAGIVYKVGGVVILPLREYERLCVRAVENFQLAGGKAEKLDHIIRDGLVEYKAGRCKNIKSLADLD